MNNSINQKYDIGIIGSGPGGYVAAIRASQNGKKVVIFEKEDLGGICLNWGCIPTKALLKSSEVYEDIKNAGYYGINVDNITPDIKVMVRRSREISHQLSQGINVLLKKHNIDVIYHEARLESCDIIKSNNTEYKLKKIIIATGAKPRVIKGFEVDNDRVWSYRDALSQQSIPKKLVIIGSGAIGIEFASFYNNLGSEVTILESANRILLSEDEEISTIAHKILTKQGIKIKLNVTLKNLDKSKDFLATIYKSDNEENKIISNKVLIAAGVKGRTENLGLENLNIKIENNKILVNKFLQTSELNIYAIGDVVHGPALAHKASHEGIIAADHASNILDHFTEDYANNIPSCIYSSPQIASIGLTESKAISLSLDFKIGRFPMKANGKALASGKKDGLIKILYQKKTGEILGAHMIGYNVTELISNFALAKQSELTDKDFLNSIFPHPTISETLPEAFMSANNKAIHI